MYKRITCCAVPQRKAPGCICVCVAVSDAWGIGELN